MKVICINGIGKDGLGLQVSEGVVYNASVSPRKGFYIIHEHPTYLGELVCYEESRFIPLSETEHTCKICGIVSPDKIVCTPEANCLNIPLEAEIKYLRTDKPSDNESNMHR